VFFRLTYVIQSLPQDFTGPLTFRYGPSHNIIVRLRRPLPEELNANVTRHDGLCEAIGEREPASHIGEMLDSLEKNLLPPGSMDPQQWGRAHLAKGFDPPFIESGNVIKAGQAVPVSILPQAFQSFESQIHNELSDYATRTVRVLRWVHGVPGHHNPVKLTLGMSWSRDGFSWRPMPHTIELRIVSSVAHSKWNDDIARNAEAVVRAGHNEPVGHELHHEAAEQAASNPRSALVIGIAAAEIGLKECISRLVPQARWLVEHAPSPPLVQMLVDFVPTLPAKATIGGKVLPPPSKIVETLKKGVAKRNQIVHGRATTLDGDTLREVLWAVRDVLYLLDIYSGFVWAEKNISYETVKALSDAATGKEDVRPR